MKYRHLFLLILVVIQGSCNRNEQEETKELPSIDRFNTENVTSAFLARIAKEPETFTVNADRDTLIVTEKGMTLFIESGTFVKDKKVYRGNLALEIVEAKSFDEMLLNNLSTATGNDFLRTQGMFHITASDKKISIAKGKQLLAKIPLKEKLKTLQLYDGVYVGEELQWKQPKALIEEEEFGNLIPIDFTTLSLSTGRYGEADFSEETISRLENPKNANTYISTYEFKERLNTLLVYSIYEPEVWKRNSNWTEERYDPSTLQRLLAIYLNNTHRNLSDVDRDVLEFVRNDIKKGLYEDPGHDYHFNEIRKKYEEYAKLNLTFPIRIKNLDLTFPLTVDKIEHSKLDKKTKSRLKFAFLNSTKNKFLNDNRVETFSKLGSVFIEIASFGWKNCDGTLENLPASELVQNMDFEVPSGDGVLNVVILAKEDGALYHFHNRENEDFSLPDFHLSRMRNKQNYHFVFFRYAGNNQVYFDEKKAFITTGIKYKLNLKKISESDFKREIASLNYVANP